MSPLDCPAVIAWLVNEHANRRNQPTAQWETGLSTVVSPSALQGWNRRELSAENWSTFNTQPLVKNSGIDLPEVGVKFHVAVLKIGQAGVFADQAWCDTIAGKANRCGGSVVCPLTRVLFQSPSELAERHRQHAVSVTMLVEIRDE